MTDTPFGLWVQRIEFLVAAGRARGWVSRAEVMAALGNPAAPAPLVDELLAALQVQGIRVTGKPEGVLLDAMTAAMKRLIERGKARGYVTYDEVHAALPPDQVCAELIEDTLANLSEIGIAIVEEKDDGD